MTRMPLVCMSIVASAFQYGCAPTLMPATTMLISPPSWVNSTIRLSAAATQSMFSVPDVHRDPGAGGQRVPLQRHPHPLGQVERGDHAAALRLGQRAERLRRVAEQHDPGDALRVPRGRRGDHAGDDRRGVAPLRPVDRHQRVVVVEVVLDEVAEQAGQLVRVHRVAAARAQHLLPVVVERLDRLVRRLADGQLGAAGGVEGDPHGDLGQLAGLPVALPRDEQDLLQPGARGRRQHAPGDHLQLLAGQLARRPDVDDDPVGVEALLRRPPRLRAADRVEAGGDGVLGRRQRDQPAVVLAQRGQVAHLRERDEALVGRVLPRHALEEVDLLVRRRQPGQVELAQPLQLHPLRDVRVQAADQPLLGHPGRSDGRKVKWWCITAPPRPATVVVSRRTCGPAAGAR